MTQRLPPLPWLRAFEAAARHLSFTLAARELNLTQAAVSKQVKLLEHFLAEPLFERKPRSLVLTKIGAAYLPKVQDSFTRLQLGTEEVFGSRRRQVLTIRAVAGFSVNWLAPRIPDFLDRHPDAQIRIVSSVWSEQFDRESFHLEIRYGLGSWHGFKADRLSWEQLTPLCAPEIAKRLKTPFDLAQERLLHVLGYQQGWATWLSAAGVSDVNTGDGIQFDTSLLTHEVAAAGGGVALGRTSMAAKEISSGRLVAPFHLHVDIPEAFYLLTPEDAAPHPDAEIFRAWILDQAKQTYHLRAI